MTADRVTYDTVVGVGDRHRFNVPLPARPRPALGTKREHHVMSTVRRIGDTRRRRDERAARIAEVVALLAAGAKQLLRRETQ